MSRKYFAAGVGIILIVTLGIAIGTLGVTPINEYDDVVKTLENYLEIRGNPDLIIGEIMEFTSHYYVVVSEMSTGKGAFELLVNKITGQITYEPGPNMMWNTKYGHQMMTGMHQYGTGPLTILENQSLILAQQYLNEYHLGTNASDPHPFYGYYTLHIENDGNIVGMLSINGYSGESWYHSWHGDYVQSWEFHD